MRTTPACSTQPPSQPSWSTTRTPVLACSLSRYSLCLCTGPSHLACKAWLELPFAMGSPTMASGHCHCPLLCRTTSGSITISRGCAYAGLRGSQSRPSKAGQILLSSPTGVVHSALCRSGGITKVFFLGKGETWNWTQYISFYHFIFYFFITLTSKEITNTVALQCAHFTTFYGLGWHSRGLGQIFPSPSVPTALL